MLKRAYQVIWSIFRGAGCCSMEDEVDLQKYLGILVRRKRIVFAVSLSILFVGIVLSFVAPPIYEANTLLFPATLADGSQSFAPLSPRPRQITNPYGYPSTLAEIVQSNAFVQATADHLALEASSFRVIAKWIPDSMDVRLTVRAYTPGTAQRMSEALAASLVQISSESIKPLRLALERLLEQARADAARFGRSSADARMLSEALSQKRNPTMEELRTRALALEAMTTADRNYQTAVERERLLSYQVAEVQGVRVIGSRAIESQVAPRKRLSITVATLLGLLGGFVSAFATESLSPVRRPTPNEGK